MRRRFTYACHKHKCGFGEAIRITNIYMMELASQ